MCFAPIRYLLALVDTVSHYVHFLECWYVTPLFRGIILAILFRALLVMLAFRDLKIIGVSLHSQKNGGSLGKQQ